ncbi:TRAP transporter small permease [Phaeovulum vinaykumarii]|uniref:TRAP transporter small permease protein n=1 Tax=Phaeovulum vinaykumarii TaxID=407234 RepID=A0A1N7MB43_9RHOB|nr:TRAP transporter small permease [Phaeovulum vinaykumarii]SIS83252.1 C4-dicarboxylate transporter, DctQ subunit [Phaeovulum vinaykumarii]SOC10336.1 C4-dicarboxylate transporter DctQ subunit [Phaeovulum vinaykumarii]
MSRAFVPQTALGRLVHSFEETAIALIMGAMTLLTFVNVVLRYVFNSSIIWGLEATLVLFAWLVLFGMAHAIKITANLGVDILLAVLPPKGRRIITLTAVAACLIYAALLMKGAWDFWAPFAGLDRTSGHWFPTGFERTRDQAWYELDVTPIPDFLRFLEPLINQGEAYEKMPRVVPYLIVPLGAFLMFVRLLEAGWHVIRGRRDCIIVSHEAEDAVVDARHLNTED